MGYEISPTCFYLTKRSLIQKPNNYEVITELKSMITKNIPTHLPPANHHRNVIVDFMAYASKLAIKKQKHTTIFSAVSGAFSAFFLSHTIGRILFLMCTKKPASKQVSKDIERQLKVQISYFRF